MTKYSQLHFKLILPPTHNILLNFVSPCSISAYGASGGAGVENSGPSKAAKVEAIFNLTAGDQLFILVGQEGESACSVSLNYQSFNH